MRNFESIKLTEVVLGAARKIIEGTTVSGIQDIPDCPGFIISSEEQKNKPELLLLGTVKDRQNREFYIYQTIATSPS